MAEKRLGDVDLNRSVIEFSLDEDAIELYKFAVACPDWTEHAVFSRLGLYGDRLASALRKLAESRLFRPSSHRDREWDAIGPDGAIVDLLADEEARVKREQAALIKIKAELRGLLPDYFEARKNRAVNEAIDVVPGDDTAVRLLKEFAGSAKEQICVTNPGGQADDLTWLAEVAESDQPRNGRVIRLVLDHSTRHDQLVRQQTHGLDQHGKAVRTVPSVPMRLALFDRSVACLRQASDDVAVVRHPAVVESLSVAFDLLWGTAQPLPVSPAGEGVLRSRLRQEILHRLADGEKDEVIARRLGLSVRTCRRHIAAIMDCLGAKSRFEAGVLAQRSILDETS